MSLLRQLLIVGFLSIALLALSQTVKAQALIDIRIPGPYTALAVVFMQDLGATTCIVNLKLVSPSTKDIFINQSQEGMSPVVYLGQLSTGTALVFEMSLSGTHPACSGTFYSNTDPKAVRIPIPMLEFMIIEWDIGDASDELALMIGIFLDEEPKTRPVVFIHGLGGHPQDWIDGNKRVYFDTLKSDPYNYPSDFLVAYAYSDADGNPATYDNQGDIILISQGLQGVVDDLAEKYSSGCSIDCVDLVGFSLGGMVIRQYLNDYPFTHKIRKAITIGSPHRGVDWLTTIEDAGELPLFGGALRGAIIGLLDLGFSAWANSLNGQPLNLNNPAVQQLYPSSDFIQQLISYAPESLDWIAVYGDIDAGITQKLFFYSLRKSISLGDLIIFKDSAQGIPVSNLEQVGFTDQPQYEAVLVSGNTPPFYRLTLDGPSIDELRYWHNSLISQSDVVKTVVDLLTN